MSDRDIIAFQKKLRNAERKHKNAMNKVYILNSALAEANKVAKSTGGHLQKIYDSYERRNL